MNDTTHPHHRPAPADQTGIDVAADNPAVTIAIGVPGVPGEASDPHPGDWPSARLESSAAHSPRALNRSSQWTPARIRALGPVTDIATAAEILGLSRSVAYDLAATGQFPTPVIRAGSRYRIPVAGLLSALHIPLEPHQAGGGGDLTKADHNAFMSNDKSDGHRTPAAHHNPNG